MYSQACAAVQPVCFAALFSTKQSRVNIGRARTQQVFREAPHRAARQRLTAIVPKAYVAEWPDKEFIAATLEMFPDEGVANADQARALWSNGGYVMLDVRSELEIETVGRVKGAVNIPYVHCTRKWDSKQQKKVLNKTDNTDFVKQMEKKFPDKNTNFIVFCGNGRKYSIDVLNELYDNGYEGVVGLKGGYKAWNKVWDNNGRRRRDGEYAEQYTHDGDSCGIHSSGAGFERVDAIGAAYDPSDEF